VSGHPFSPKNWVELMGAQRFSEVFGADVNPITRRRVMRSPSGREVDDSTVSSGRNLYGSGVVEHVAAKESDQDVH
jgi:hypothetical protein